MKEHNPPCMVSVRVWGDFACYTRPELKGERVSAPILTPSAARGLLEAIYYEPQMYYWIHEIGVLRRGRWFNFRRNEIKKVISIKEAGRAMVEGGGLAPIRAGGGAPDATQRGMLALADVEYLITAEIRLTHRADPSRGDSLEKYRGLFNRRAETGKCTHRPYLGCREFDAFFAPVEDPKAVELCKDWPKEDLGILLYDVFDPFGRDSGLPLRPEPVFFHAFVKNARLDCHPDRIKLIRKGVAS